MAQYKGLNKAQKELLEDKGEMCFDVDELPANVMDEFMRLGNHELMYQAANRLLSDKEFERQYGNKNRW